MHNIFSGLGSLNLMHASCRSPEPYPQFNARLIAVSLSCFTNLFLFNSITIVLSTMTIYVS